MKYSEWLNLSDQERLELARSWNPFEGDGVGLLRCAVRRFRKEYADLPGLCSVTSALYHGSVLGIVVAFTKGVRPRGPVRSFEGFPIFRGHERAKRIGRASRSKSGRSTQASDSSVNDRRRTIPTALAHSKRNLGHRRTGSGR